RVFFFFFQAEDGIRDFHVTGVQTCALPIWSHAEQGRAPRRRQQGPRLRDRRGRERRLRLALRHVGARHARAGEDRPVRRHVRRRSEERRVGKSVDTGGRRRGTTKKRHWYVA